MELPVDISEPQPNVLNARNAPVLRAQSSEASSHFSDEVTDQAKAAVKLDEAGKVLARNLKADVLGYWGDISYGSIRIFRDKIETLVGTRTERPLCLAIVLTTTGGVVEVVEKLVEITRHHYNSVDFYVPDFAMSAGTVWCMSGNRIFMNYASSLGPVDPQVRTRDGKGSGYTAAMGYLDRYERLMNETFDRRLSHAEQQVLLSFDQGDLAFYEQARDLSKDLIIDWLLQSDSVDWTRMEKEPHVAGQSLTPDRKRQLANGIATNLANHTIWHSHSRMIGMKTLCDRFGLRIYSFDEEIDLSGAILSYDRQLEAGWKDVPGTFVHTAAYDVIATGHETGSEYEGT